MPAKYKNTEEKYLLTGKLFCGKCGSSMSGISGTAKSKESYRYYQCMNSKKKKCSKKNIQKSVIENAVLNMTMQILKDSELIKEISERCYSMQSTESSRVPILKKQMKSIQKEIDNVMSAIKAGIITKSTKTTLTKLEEQQENIEIELAREQITHPIVSREQIEYWIMQYAKTSLDSEEQKQRLIDVFINSVYVYDDEIVVFFNFKDGERTISLEEVNETKREHSPK